MHAAAGGMGLILCRVGEGGGRDRGRHAVSTEAKAEAARAAGCHHPVVRAAGRASWTWCARSPAARVWPSSTRRSARTRCNSHWIRCGPSGVCAAYGHVSGPSDPVDIIQDLGRRGSLFITRPAIVHYPGATDSRRFSLDAIPRASVPLGPTPCDSASSMDDLHPPRDVEDRRVRRRRLRVRIRCAREARIGADRRCREHPSSLGRIGRRHDSRQARVVSASSSRAGKLQSPVKIDALQGVWRVSAALNGFSTVTPEKFMPGCKSSESNVEQPPARAASTIAASQ